MNGILNRVRTWLGRSTNGTVNHAVSAPVEPASTLVETVHSGRDNVAVGGSATVGATPRPKLVVEHERDDCSGPARCRKCDAELELVCPAGHGGADEVLADMVAPKRAPAPVTSEKPETLHSVSGCNSPRVPWKGRGRKPTRCGAHLTKHPEQKRAL